MSERLEPLDGTGQRVRSMEVVTRAMRPAAVDYIRQKARKYTPG